MFEVSNLKFVELENRLEENKYTQLKNEILGLMFTQRIQTFHDESSPRGPWAPIKDVDAKLSSSRKDFKKGSQSKKAQKFRENDKILQDKGVLRNSFTKHSQGSNHSIEGEQVSLVSNVEYAQVQNDGRLDADHPARPFNEFSEQDIEEINELIGVFVRGD